MLSIQEIFNIICKHLLEQQERCSDGSNCLYYGEHGQRCAVGCLIKPEFYSTSLERNDVTYPSVTDALIKSQVDMNNIAIKNLLLDCQSMHDYETPNHWHNDLKRIAEKYSLIFNI